MIQADWAKRRRSWGSFSFAIPRDFHNGTDFDTFGGKILVKNSLLKPLGMTKFSTNRNWIYLVISLFGSGVTPEFSSFSITKKIVLSSPAHRYDHDYQFPDVFRRGLCLRRSSECLLIECFAFTKNPAAGRRNGSPYHESPRGSMESVDFYLCDYHKRYCYPRGCLALRLPQSASTGSHRIAD